MDEARPRRQVLSLRERGRRALVAAAAGLLLDAADLASFGPLGPWLGLPLGAALGALLAPRLGLAATRRARALAAVLGAAYCALPTTELVPLATLLGAAVRFGAEPDPRASAPPRAPP